MGVAAGFGCLGFRAWRGVELKGRKSPGSGLVVNGDSGWSIAKPPGTLAEAHKTLWPSEYYQEAEYPKL